MSFTKSAYRILSRKKIITSEVLGTTQLNKCLTTLDLTALSIGSTLGVGVYVLAGQVSKNVAGPAVILSFLIAAIASIFAGLCYAEFGARVPKAGSAYIYSYVCVGELVAFIIGWNLILEYVIGAASVVKGMSTYLDDLIDNKMSSYLNETMPIRVEHFAEYPDFLAFGVTMVFTGAVAFGARESTLVNNIFTFVNLVIVVFVIIAGFINVEPANWSIPEEVASAVKDCGEKENESCGVGGFAPYGFSGIIKGAATCFYGFIGFDTIATAGEEAKTPQKSIPVATVVSLTIIFLAYFFISTVLTMMSPYYDQNVNAPLPYVFDKVGWPVAKYIVSIGAICGLCSSLFGALFPLPRIIYAMSNDRLIFGFLGKVHPRFQTPFYGTILAGLLTGIMATFFQLEQLFTMMSIGTLLAYSMVAACVLILRYDNDEYPDEKNEESSVTVRDFLAQMVNFKSKASSKASAAVVTWLVALYTALCFGVGATLSQMENQLSVGDPGTIALLCILSVLLIVTIALINMQPVSSTRLSFHVPFVPWIPGLSILINLYLMTKLDAMTWLRFAIWIIIGLAIYFAYGIRNSKQRHRPQILSTEDSTMQQTSVLPKQKSILDTIIMSTWWKILSRRKRVDPVATSTDTQLARVLSTFDLTALGVGSTLGVGVYVLAGHVAKDIAGPSVVLSFLIAAIASVFAGLCYAEFGARVPRAGSAYIYSYVCVGEFIAFIIGWNLILEYVIGSASVARGLSLYLDTLLNNTLKETFREIAPIDSTFMSQYFDFFSFGITLLLGVALAFGLKESSLMNNIFTILNIAVVLFVILAGSVKADPQNWKLPANVTIGAGAGGFFPFGISGTIKGAATCFYGFVGFDCIATTGEEVKNPKRAIPIAIIVSLLIIFLSYFGTSAVVTLMWPYYLQDSNAPIPHVFAEIGWDWAKWIVSIGGIFGLCASLFGAMFPLPRIIYAMASDALVFKFLGTVNERFRTPVIGTLLAALLTGAMSALFDLTQLVNMMSIGTLMAYTIVAACVIILRFSVDEEEIAEWRYSLLQAEMDSDDEYSIDGHYYGMNDDEDLQLIAPKQKITAAILSLILAALVAYLQSDLEVGNLLVVIPTAIVVGLMLVTLFSIWVQPTSKASLSFKVPLVPLIPALSICINLYLMMMLDGNTWIRFAIWMAIGLPIYFISCKLYKTVDAKPTAQQNGHLNNGYITSNGSVLTIPEIKVVPATINEPVGMESETQQSIKELNKEETHALQLLNKILDEQHANVANDVDNTSTCSTTESESDCSQEHHIEAVVHQEDSGKNFERSNFNLQNEENFNSARSSIILTDKQLGDESSDDVPTQYEEIEARLEDMENVSDNEASHIAKLNEDIVSLNKDVTVKSEEGPRGNEEIKEPQKLDELFQTKEANSEPAPFIPPPPPPMSGLLDLAAPMPAPRKQYQQVPFIIPNKVVLRETPKARKRTESTNSNDDDDVNVTPGSVQYSRIKAKLDKIYRNRPVPNVPDRKFTVDDRSLSPLAAKELELIDQVLDQYEEEIPADFAKTKEFKESLNSLLLRRQSTNSARSSFAQKYEKNNNNTAKIDAAQVQEQLEENTAPKEEKQDEVKSEVKEDIEDEAKSEMKEDIEDKERELDDNFEENVKKRMADMRQKLLGLLVTNPNEEKSVKPKDDKEKNISNEETKKHIFEKHNQPVQNSPEKDKAEHKKKMVLTLRSIKLKKTGIALNEDDHNEENTVQGRDSDENKPGTDKDEHNRKMLGTLRSIKLRNTGVALNEGDDPNEEPSYDKTNESEESKKQKAIEEHKRKMVRTLRSIKLKKTGISLNEDDATVE
ncbi:uncharacterized protein CBL_09842 [Carabus blaptoides fortunei]